MIKLKSLLNQDNNQKSVQVTLTHPPRMYTLTVTPKGADLISTGFRMSFTNVFKDTENTLKNKIQFMRFDSYIVPKLQQLAKKVGYDSNKFAIELQKGGVTHEWLNLVAKVS